MVKVGTFHDVKGIPGKLCTMSRDTAATRGSKKMDLTKEKGSELENDGMETQCSTRKLEGQCLLVI